MHDPREDRPTTRADFDSDEDWARYLRRSCLPMEDEDGQATWVYIGGSGPEASLHRAIHGWTKRQYEQAAGVWGVTAYLRNRQFMKLYDAVRLANCRGLVPNALVNVSWSTVGIVSDLAVRSAHEQLLELMRKWLVERQISQAWLWVLERGDTFGLHSHIAVHVPHVYEDAFASWVAKAVRTIAKRSIVVNRRTKVYTVKVKHASDDAWRVQWKIFRYLMKGVDPWTRVKDPKQRHGTKLLRDVAGLKSVAQGEVSTKRAGVARQLDTTEQRKFWQSHDVPPCPLRHGAAKPQDAFTDVYLRWFEQKEVVRGLTGGAWQSREP